MSKIESLAAADLLRFAGKRRFGTIFADPPWQFTNKTGKVAPEHKRLARYSTMKLDEIMALPVAQVSAPTSHLYLWCPNALLPEGLATMKAWGFQYKANVVWHKIRKDGGPDGRGVGFYFRNVTELILFGVRGKNARTLAPGRSQVNFLATAASGSIRASRMSSTRFSKRAVQDHFWKCLREVRARVGRHGAIRRMMAMRRRGRRTQIIRAPGFHRSGVVMAARVAAFPVILKQA